ncbi:Bug family tripartite tricarboxylate transporter substrate binding protein [Sabulicella glaciei]|uniref:Tripartite tricarboxylate transporter substrate-binding protein n=1 Tax=Sabulicella glaciei TaxID=2984948 RepID=A0ABT3NR33_9PROT|nr:tripartite tricarboxylate transporter substrate-binding protein [Roseococcus sp. MDT2-1-1]MCW8084618.1 tripartite tricarboxylate transporter substrate-binding protein [Roseococcus sp. MDT2-1-1]
MQHNLSRRGLALAGGALLAAPALAQSPWPDKPIRLIVPFGPGGAIDTLSRNVASRFAEHTNGQTLVVENRPGAGGTIAGAFAATQRPDGQVLMMADMGANAIGRLLYPGLPYDPLTAFTPIIHLVNLPGVLMAHPSVAERSVEEIVRAAKARPDGFTYSSAGTGNGSHLFMELFLKRAGIRMVHVPYRSGAEMVTALVRGDAQFGFPTVSSGLAMIRDGRARAVAVSEPAGSQLLPGTPGLAAALPGFDQSVWHGIVAPAGMDRSLVLRINDVFGRIAAMPEVQEAVFRQQAGRVVGGTPAEFAAHIRREYETWEPVIRDANIKAD